MTEEAKHQIGSVRCKNCDHFYNTFFEERCPYCLMRIDTEGFDAHALESVKNFAAAVLKGNEIPGLTEVFDRQAQVHDNGQ
ncbi:MAG TPA: hypothetical protein VMU27_01450 [Candidatus Paceibacterota bacterium]|nr:hypothetical protein [Candidatus Paceibacterota bacterium]